MKQMRTLCRLFLSIERVDDGLRFEIRVNPHREEVSRGGSIAVISCSSFEDLGICFEDLGVTGWSRFVRESETGPVTEHVPSSTVALLEHLRTNRPSTATLIAADASVEDMYGRIALLKAKATDESGIRIRDVA